MYVYIEHVLIWVRFGPKIIKFWIKNQQNWADKNERATQIKINRCYEFSEQNTLYAYNDKHTKYLPSKLALSPFLQIIYSTNELPNDSWCVIIVATNSAHRKCCLRTNLRRIREPISRVNSQNWFIGI